MAYKSQYTNKKKEGSQHDREVLYLSSMYLNWNGQGLAVLRICDYIQETL